jgi:hypothetical protein
MGAYQIISDPILSTNYLQTVRIRSFLSQQISSYRDDRKGWHYPFLVFVVGEGEDTLMLEIDFVRKVIIFRQKDHDKIEYAFHQISWVMQGRDHDQFILEFNISKSKPKILEAVYQGQRDLIVKVLIFAWEIFVKSDYSEKTEDLMQVYYFTL